MWKSGYDINIGIIHQICLFPKKMGKTKFSLLKFILLLLDFLMSFGMARTKANFLHVGRFITIENNEFH